jgi:hypothetical protein
MTRPTHSLDMRPIFKKGDMLRPNPDGSVSLLRETNDYRKFMAIETWDRPSREIRRLIADDDPAIVSRHRPGRCCCIQPCTHSNHGLAVLRVIAGFRAEAIGEGRPSQFRPPLSAPRDRLAPRPTPVATIETVSRPDTHVPLPFLL